MASSTSHNKYGPVKRQSQSQSYITTDSQSASPSWYQPPIWDPRPIFPILSLIIFFLQFRVCLCGAPSLTRSRVCTSQFLPVIASAAFLRSQSHGTHEHSLLLPQPGGPGSCIYLFISARSKVFQLYLRVLCWPVKRVALDFFIVWRDFMVTHRSP
jgi:hypothetical protein